MSVTQKASRVSNPDMHLEIKTGEQRKDIKYISPRLTHTYPILRSGCRFPWGSSGAAWDMVGEANPHRLGCPVDKFGPLPVSAAGRALSQIYILDICFRRVLKWEKLRAISKTFWGRVCRSDKLGLCMDKEVEDAEKYMWRRIMGVNALSSVTTIWCTQGSLCRAGIGA